MQRNVCGVTGLANGVTIRCAPCLASISFAFIRIFRLLLEQAPAPATAYGSRGAAPIEADELGIRTID